ncbi:MAG: protein-disulfide reductase DsbD domain-containing protein [Paracoccus sp. (in: a-proteobacteria)]
MTKISAALLSTLLLTLPNTALPQTGGGDLPLGLVSARLLPGWTDAQGNRVSALELVLEPGWKTYWRSPGDSGLPPSFDWSGSDNLDQITMHWPAPDAINSGGAQELGYHDHLVLPFTASPRQPGEPIGLNGQIDLGLCDNICVPASLDLSAPPVGQGTDSRISAALAEAPQMIDDLPDCRIDDIADGLRVEMALPGPTPELAAIEVEGKPDLWISGAGIKMGSAGPVAVAEMVGPGAAPFPLDPGALRLTVVSAEGAIETLGCRLLP